MRLFLAFILLCAASPALALTCQNDYAGAAGCAANSSAAGDCETLGFSKTSEAGCKHFLYCPFDTSYKRCVSSDSSVDCATLGFTKTDKSSWCSSLVSCPADNSYSLCSDGKGIDCTGYPLLSCPSTAATCLPCGNGTDIKYKIAVCNTGYTVNSTGSSCTANTCSGYALYSCPDGGNCDTCLSGGSTKYKLTGCKTDYVYENGSCYDCITNYNRIRNRVYIAQNSYRRCSEPNPSNCTKCRSSCTDYTSRGSYYAASCFSFSGAPGGSGDLNVCLDALQTVKNEVVTHNAKACASKYRISESINPSSQCNTEIQCGYAVTYSGS